MRLFKYLVVLISLFLTAGNISAQSIYSFSVTTIEGKQTTLADFKGKTILIVNVASKCGLTKQYEGLEALYKKYKDRGFVILGFPCNQFMGQEPGTEAEIVEFCSVNYNVTFPLFSKIEVNGDLAHPLYQYLKKKLPGTGSKPDIEWNFAKFLIDKDGNPVSRYLPRVKPAELESDIVAQLKK